MPKKTKENVASEPRKKRGKPQKYGSGTCYPLSISAPPDLISGLDRYASAAKISRSDAAVGFIRAGLDTAASKSNTI